MVYLIVVVFLIVLRLFEVVWAKLNERFQQKRGGITVDDPYYTFVVLLHTGFLASLIVESFIAHQWSANTSDIWLTVFIVLQLLRFHVLMTLGRHWNTKVVVNPTSADRIKRGLFRYIDHPNYWIVLAELIVIPLLFEAYVTAILFPMGHLFFMSKRIPLENEALTLYDKK
ncbi:methyltransferase [Alkalibacillus flavidus]|uniref:Methyltransferase n=1 Tax=Alkalibacillus flavidus TaxID=546021 RepID=A0ABV2KRU3_9BACI